MSEVPSLITLCIDAIKDAILDENGNLAYVYTLPPELFDQILPALPSLALQNLQDAMPSLSLNPSNKRKRFDNFDIAWKALYQSRWTNVQKLVKNVIRKGVHHDEATTNWQQIYWERQLQNCLDAAAETLAITLFDGFLGEVEIPDDLLQSISSKGHVSKLRNYLTLTYQCERFGVHARCLRLQNVHCVAGISSLLRNSRLEYLEVNWLKSKEQVNALCKLLEQNKETLTSVDFVHCKLPANLVTAICDSLHVKGFEANAVIKSFSIKRSSFLDSSSFPLPLGLESFLTTARSSLTSLTLSDNHIWWKTAKLVFDTLLEAESGVQVLDLSENNISGWLSHFKRQPDLQISKYLNSLRALNLRCNNLNKDDVDHLTYALVHMPNVEILNLSENHLQDDGITILIPYLFKKSKSKTPLVELNLEHCEMTRVGAKRLLKALALLTVPLKSLLIGNNRLSRKYIPHTDFGKYVGRFLRSGIESFDIKRIGLDTSGLSRAEREITQQLNLVHINISGNDGRAGTASFLSKLISNAPKLVSFEARNNLIPDSSLNDICSCLTAANGKLELLDLQKNPLGGKPNIGSILAEFQINGKPNILISSTNATLYDQDP